MANAPTPGRKRAKRQGFRVTVYGQVYELQLRDMGPQDEGLVRQTTGKPFTTYISEYGIDSLAVIVWIARRKAGEKKLTLAKVFETFPSLWDFNDSDDHDFEVLEDLDENALDGESVEVETHPLPAAGS